MARQSVLPDEPAVITGPGVVRLATEELEDSVMLGARHIHAGVGCEHIVQLPRVRDGRSRALIDGLLVVVAQAALECAAR